METILKDFPDRKPSFAIRINDRFEIIAIEGIEELTQEEAGKIIDLVIQKTYGFRIRNRWLGRVPTPFIEYNGNYLAFTSVLPTDWLLTQTEDSESQDRYFIFEDASSVFDELYELRLIFLILGIIVFCMVGIITYFVAKLLVKPSERALQKQKQFIADASHELKTPLTMIKANLDMLKIEEMATIKTKSNWVDNIKFGYERMNNLTINLLTLAQLEEETLSIATQVFDISQTTIWLIRLMQPRLDEKAIKVQTDIEPDVLVKQNAEKMMQVLNILLDNAIKYSENNGWLKVEIKKKRNLVVVTIKNSGAGISAQQLPKIFERFYRADESRNSDNKSYGLGLPIAKGIIEQAGGKITATSIENKVTTFSFSIKSCLS